MKLIVAFACALLPMLCSAWQDEALASLASQVVAWEKLSPTRMLSTPPDVEPAAQAKIAPHTPLSEGFSLWQREMPELLRRTAETGNAALRSPHGFTALQAACLAGDAKLIRALLDAGAPADARPAAGENMGMVGESPLSLLTACTALPVEEMLPLARMLLERGAEPDEKVLRIIWIGIGGRYMYKKCYGPLIFGDRPWTNDSDHRKLDFLLLQYGEQDYAKRFNPGSALNIPWWILDSATIRRLLEGGADPNASPTWMRGALPSERSKVSLLQHLVGRGDVENVALALNRGAQVRKRDLFFIRTTRETHPLTTADEVAYTPERALKIAALLLAHGADAHAKNGEGQTLPEAYSRKSGEIAEALSDFFRARGAARLP